VSARGRGRVRGGCVCKGACPGLRGLFPQGGVAGSEGADCTLGGVARFEGTVVRKRTCSGPRRLLSAKGAWPGPQSRVRKGALPGLRGLCVCKGA